MTKVIAVAGEISGILSGEELTNIISDLCTTTQQGCRQSFRMATRIITRATDSTICTADSNTLYKSACQLSWAAAKAELTLEMDEILDLFAPLKTPAPAILARYFH